MTQQVDESDVANLVENDRLGILSNYLQDDDPFSLDSGNKPKYSSAMSNVTTVPHMKLSWHDINSRPSANSTTSSFMGMTDKTGDILQKRPYILKNVYGVAEPGEVLAIMGASGAGKTSLLNILTQQNLQGVALSGKIKVNGVEVDANLLRRVSAYVQQTDLFIGSMTVYEHLNFVANLRMGRTSTKDQIEKRINFLIDELGLRKCAKNVIGWPHKEKGISGGERKRLAFASEVVTAPPLLFCDEPTSGLDSFLARQVIQVLKNLAAKHRMTIVVTIHQPSSQVFELFDKICFMAEGRVAYFGTIPKAIEYWSRLGKAIPKNFNPADHIINTLAIKKKIEIKCQKEVKQICDNFDACEAGKELYDAAVGMRRGAHPSFLTFDDLVESDPKLRNKTAHQYKATYCQQLRFLIHRGLLVTIREPMLLKVRLFQSIAIALILGLVYWQTPINQETVMNVNGLIFQSISNLNFMFQFVIVYLFCDELPIFLREHHSSLYRVDAYFIAKMIADIPQFVLYPVVFSTIVYWMVGLNATAWSFFIFLLCGTLVTNVAISIGYMASCIFSSVGVAVAIMPIFTIPLLAFSGFYINIANLPWYFAWLRYFSYFGYAFEAMSINEWVNHDTIDGCTIIPGTNTTVPHNCYPSGQDVLKIYSFDASHEYLNIFLLIVLIVAIRGIAFLALLRKARATN